MFQIFVLLISEYTVCNEITLLAYFSDQDRSTYMINLIEGLV